MKASKLRKASKAAAHGVVSSALEDSPIHLLHRAGQFAGDIFQSKMGESDLTPRQYAVLLTVAGNEGLSQTQLVDKTGIDRSTLADIVRRMLKKGLIQRRRTREDARAYAVKLSEDGWRLLKAVEPIARDVDAAIIATLSGEDRERFIGLLNTIVLQLGQMTPKEAG